jgi:hypothetical protein
MMNYFSFAPNFTLQMQQTPQSQASRPPLPSNIILSSKTVAT